MSHALDLEMLKKHFAPAWAAYGEKTVNVLYGNDKPAATDTFIRFTVRPSGSDDTALGDGRTRTENFGRIWMQIGVPLSAQESVAFKLVDKATAIFQRYRSTTGDLRCSDIETAFRSETAHFIGTVQVVYNSVHYS